MSEGAHNMTKVTIKDVAKAAGVSISTVSNALNDVDVLKQETKEHILNVAKQLNYFPNQQGRLLKSKSSQHIMFITATLSGPYFNRLIEALNTLCNAHQYTLHIVIAQSETDLKEAILGNRYDGYIVFMPHITHDALEAYQQASSRPIIAIDRKLDTTIKSVTFDNDLTVYTLTKSLIDSGSQSFLFLSGREDMYDAQSRKFGFLKALQEVTTTTHTLLQGDFTKETAYTLVKQHLTHTPDHYDAVVCANDQMAIGALDALKELGYSIPKDLKLVGFDNIELCEYMTPPLTTINNDLDLLAKECIDLLIKMIEKEPVSSKILPGTIIHRGSSK